MKGSGTHAADRPIYGSVLGLTRVKVDPSELPKPAAKSHPGLKAAQGMNTAMTLGILCHSLQHGDFQSAKNVLVRVFTQVAGLAHASEKFAFLKQFDKEKFFLTLSSASMAIRSPQLYNTMQAGTALPRVLALLVTTAFILQATPVVDKMSRSAEKQLESFLQTNETAKTVIKRGPQVCLGLNAIGSIAQGYLQRNWYTVATGMTYLAGLGVTLGTEKYLTSRTPQTDPAIAHTQIEESPADTAAVPHHNHD